VGDTIVQLLKSVRERGNSIKAFLITSLIGSLIFVFDSACASTLTVRKNTTEYVIENGRFVATVSRTNGMVESLQLIESNFEIASDYPNYSIFFPEFLYEHPDGLAGTFYFPSSKLCGLPARLTRIGSTSLNPTNRFFGFRSHAKLYQTVFTAISNNVRCIIPIWTIPLS
jgi:hypothetical protein